MVEEMLQLDAVERLVLVGRQMDGVGWYVHRLDVGRHPQHVVGEALLYLYAEVELLLCVGVVDDGDVEVAPQVVDILAGLRWQHALDGRHLECDVALLVLCCGGVK